MSRVYNFSAGPAVLPEEVLNEAAAEMLDYRGTGMSVMEMSHRSKSYETIIEDAESDLRDLLEFSWNIWCLLFLIFVHPFIYICKRLPCMMQMGKFSCITQRSHLCIYALV